MFLSSCYRGSHIRVFWFWVPIFIKNHTLVCDSLYPTIQVIFNNLLIISHKNEPLVMGPWSMGHKYLIPKMTFASGLSLNSSKVIGAAGKSTHEGKPFNSSIACSPSSLSRTSAHASRRSYKRTVLIRIFWGSHPNGTTYVRLFELLIIMIKSFWENSNFKVSGPDRQNRSENGKIFFDSNTYLWWY